METHGRLPGMDGWSFRVWAGMRGGLRDYHYAHTRPAPRSMNAVRPCCVIEPSPGDPLVTARVHGALSAVPSNRYLGEYTPVLYCIVRLSQSLLELLDTHAHLHDC